ncbi:family 20 glycosylhydrolase [Flavobacterium gilvum]|uniref:beta-N-acetylhexosaminidase n=1 Tax=Flavobacterium gilvum TaxID=1492737 RepID=A0AAC9I4K9_9FLAO|nr:family 20 glycosylhydrolase [Flavobacterium gilvum]AOW10291.1 hypothetical protein EM308_12680 [Flavobacterium gilvum]KFC58173.1 beta-L-N-acetylhexosaminidase [Flavobacterium gilvum]
MKKAFLLLLLPFFCLAQAPYRVSIIPKPQNITFNEGGFVLKNGSTVGVTDPSLAPLANYLVATIAKENGLDLKVEKSGKTDITLSLGYKSEKSEAYKMDVSSNGIAISGASPAGILMSVATLQQLIPVGVSQTKIQFLKIEDYPRYNYRGAHLDVSRHFYSEEEVKHFLDLMARYKLNKFHWHLTDDQGWRIEIKKYPLLTEKGAWRKLNSQDRDCIKLSKEQDNSDFKLPKEHLKIVDNDTLYGGFYTQEQIKNVVKYAKERGIDVLPEIDMPGHFMAAIIGYPYLSCKGAAHMGTIFSDPLCVGNNESLKLAKGIYTEVAGLFPYEYMHLGADEVERTNWTACPKCQAKVKKEHLKGVEELQAWFVHDMEKHFNKLGKKLIGWDEILDGGLSPTATIMWWRNWAPKAIPTATEQGNKVIASPCFEMYFDLLEGPTSLESAYKYDPLKGLTPKQAKNVIGLQGNLWAETVPTVRRAEHQYFPRYFALSEGAWNGGKNGWEEFRSRVANEIEYLDAKKINYRVPNLTGFNDLNVFTDNETVTVNNILPNIIVRYTTDGSIPQATSTRYIAPFTVNETTKFNFRSFRSDGSGSEVYKAEFRKESYSKAYEGVFAGEGIIVKEYDSKSKKCADIKNSKLVKEYKSESMEMPKDFKGYAGLIFEGYFEVKSDGVYTFELASNDGSMLYVDGAMVIDNDGPHGNKAKTGQKALAKGWHKMTAEYFDLDSGGNFSVKIKSVDDKGFMMMNHFKN